VTVRAAWSFDDPDPTLYDEFHSRGVLEHQGIGEGYEGSAQLDRLLERQRQELNADARRNLVIEVQRRLVEDAVRTWIIAPASLTFVPPWLSNVHVMLGGLGTAYRLPPTVVVTGGPRGG
jgi:ABC-type transport system substrate-binding protein